MTNEEIKEAIRELKDSLDPYFFNIGTWDFQVFMFDSDKKQNISAFHNGKYIFNFHPESKEQLIKVINFIKDELQ